MKFYTYCSVFGNNVLLRGYDEGEHIQEKIQFSPTFFINSNKKTDWTSLYTSEYLEEVKFDTIKEARDFKERYKEVEGFSVHGMDKYQYQFIHDNYPGEISYDLKLIKILTLDIEVISETGFPNIRNASDPITLISLHNSKTDLTLVLGLKDYKSSEEDNFEYIKFNSEESLLKYFISYNQVNNFDVWTGWNSTQFDIPYLVNRIVNLFDIEMAKKLSPFNHIQEKNTELFGKEVQTWDIYGIVDLDYLELYKKFSQNDRESYTLGAIAKEELGETKLELPGKSFSDNYHNHFQIFCQYNAVDTLLVNKLEKKMKLVELAFSMAYLIKCNVVDIYKTVLPWEVYIYNSLSAKNIAVPPRRSTQSAEFAGAWVKEPKPGLYGWMLSFDFSSLYNSIIRQWNMSPETISDEKLEISVKDWIDNNNNSDSSSEYAKNNNCTIAANGTLYSKVKVGILAECMTNIANGRKVARKRMNELEIELSSIESELIKRKNDK